MSQSCGSCDGIAQYLEEDKTFGRGEAYGGVFTNDQEKLIVDAQVGMENSLYNISTVVLIIFAVLLVMFVFPKIFRKDNFVDLINEGNLSNMLYYQQPYGKLGDNDH
jgi:hypothetical protein